MENIEILASANQIEILEEVCRSRGNPIIRIERQGDQHVLFFRNETPTLNELQAIISSDTALNIIKDTAIQKINKEAENHQKKLVPPELVEEYKRKEIAAKAFMAETASDADKAILQVEADALGIDIADHAQAILLKVALLDGVWSQIVEFRAKTKVAVQNATSATEIDAILLDAKQQADAAFAQLEA